MRCVVFTTVQEVPFFTLEGISERIGSFRLPIACLCLGSFLICGSFSFLLGFYWMFIGVLVVYGRRAIYVLYWCVYCVSLGRRSRFLLLLSFSYSHFSNYNYHDHSLVILLLLSPPPLRAPSLPLYPSSSSPHSTVVDTSIHQYIPILHPPLENTAKCKNHAIWTIPL